MSKSHEKALEKKKFGVRSVKGGGMNIKQLITPKHVFSVTSNSSGSNGDIHKFRFSHKKRSETNL